MSKKPVSFAELIETDGGSQHVLYPAQLRAELCRESSYFSKLSKPDQTALVKFLYHLDGLSAAAASNLNSQWTAAELSFFAPPVIATISGKPLRDRDIKAWEKQRQHWLCFENCQAARQAVLRGKFISALDIVLAAGEYSHAAYAEIGRKVRAPLPAKGKEKSGRQQRDKQLLDEAAKIRAEGKHITDSQVAQIIIQRGRNFGLAKGTVRKAIARK